MTYQYGEHKIELKSTTGNFELYINGEVQATTKGGVKIQLSPDIFLTAKLPSGEDVLAVKKEKLGIIKNRAEFLVFVGKELTPQE